MDTLSLSHQLINIQWTHDNLFCKIANKNFTLHNGYDKGDLTCAAHRGRLVNLEVIIAWLEQVTNDFIVDFQVRHTQ